MIVDRFKRDRHRNITFEDLRGLRAEAYVRDSTLDQRDGFGPDIQKHNIQRFAGSYGLVLGERWYTEFISGRQAGKRTVFQQFIEDAYLDAYDVLLVDHTSRFGRNQEECIRFKSELQKLGKIVVFVAQGIISGSDRDFLNERINETLDEQYSRNLSRYVMAGMAEKAAQGLANGVPPLGYRSEKLGNGRRERKVPDRQGINGDPRLGGMEALVALLKGYAAGEYSYRSLAEALNSWGYRNRQGQPFTKGSVEHVLSNRFYQGKVVYHPGETDEEVVDGVHEVPEEVRELWLQCQEVREPRVRQKEGRPRVATRSYPFTRVAVCDACNLPYGGQPVLQKSGEVVRRLYHKRPFCELTPHSVRVEDLMGQFQERVLPHIALDQDWKAAVLRAMHPESEAPDSGQDKMRLERALCNLRKQHLWGDVSDDEYREQRRLLERQLKAMEPGPALTQLPNLERAAGLLTDLGSLWTHPGVADRQRETFIKEVFERVHLRGKELVAIQPKTSYKPLFAYIVVQGVRKCWGGQARSAVSRPEGEAQCGLDTASPLRYDACSTSESATQNLE